MHVSLPDCPCSGGLRSTKGGTGANRVPRRSKAHMTREMGCQDIYPRVSPRSDWDTWRWTLTAKATSEQTEHASVEVSRGRT
jgi:hypothetical protein